MESLDSTRPETYLLLWNPGLFPWDNHREVAASVTAGKSQTLEWSTGARKQMPVGSHVLLTRVGRDQPGVVLSGTTVAPVETRAHFDPARATAGDTANYVKFRVDLMVDVAERAPLDLRDRFDQAFRSYNWTPQASGIVVPDEIASRALTVWRAYVTAPPAAGPAFGRLRTAPRVYAAVDAWRERCLLKDGSALSDGSVWTTDNVTALITHFVDKPDEGDRSFLLKLQDQLASAPKGASQLAAEMLWLMMLFPDRIGGDSKRTLVQTVWDWSGAKLPDGHPLLAGLDEGIGSTGTAYNTRRPFELMLLVRFAAAWKGLPMQEQQALLAEPMAFAEWFDRLPEVDGKQIRHILLHLLFPEYFPRVGSRGHKRQIDDAFRYLLSPEELETAPTDSPLDRDRRILMIGRRLNAAYPDLAPVDFYSSQPVRQEWMPLPRAVKEDPLVPYVPTPAEQESASESRTWVIAAGEGARLLSTFLERNIIAIGWEELGDLREYATQSALTKAIRKAYGRANPTNDALCCYQFCREMADGDRVYIKQGRSRILASGIVKGEYRHDPSLAEYPNVRSIQWEQRGNWALPAGVLLPTKTLTDVTNVESFNDWVEANVLQEDTPAPVLVPYSVANLLTEVFWDEETIRDLLGSLRRRRNLILQGPPGVGKTYLARRLAYALIGTKRPEAVQLVQFHQSYSYEDFIQGWRPSEGGGFALRNGVFYEFCQKAQAEPARDYVFIIDEVNRGNLSKIFGELLMLIEADKRGPEFAIPLTYSESGTDTYFIPKNVYLLGMMNTADRSLAMVDFALRRRFAFRTLRPALGSPGFRATLAEKGVEDAVINRIIDRIERVNAMIEEDHKNLGAGFLIGHSFFCPTDAVTDADAWYGAVVRDEILPLLQEYWFDNAKALDESRSILEG
ncbi:MAG TPA: AAA family ATPase [Gemmatimonadaceae bacterium]|nr:AAA family ATPase [Gemmatimonadaceae bacterium]HRQ77523.1 AAA family ATPase [Gemmatimonadaceae bacterium]